MATSPRLLASPTGLPGPTTWRIRIPARGLAQGVAGLRGVLAHEYTHVVVVHLSRDRAPRWLNEGLALHVQGAGPAAAAAARRLAAGRLLPLVALEGAFVQVRDRALAEVAYTQSASATAFLLERAGVQEVGRLLQRRGEGVSWERALEEAARMDAATFEREWQEHLRR